MIGLKETAEVGAAFGVGLVIDFIMNTSTSELIAQNIGFYKEFMLFLQSFPNLVPQAAVGIGSWAGIRTLGFILTGIKREFSGGKSYKGDKNGFGSKYGQGYNDDDLGRYPN